MSRPYYQIFKSDDFNTRLAKRRLRARIKSKRKKLVENRLQNKPPAKKDLVKPIQHFLSIDDEIAHFYNLNQSRIWDYKQKTIQLTSDFNLFDNPDKVLGTLLVMLHKAKSNSQYISFNYKSGVGIGALYFIDTICWEIAKGKRWFLKLNNLPPVEMEILRNLKSFKTQCSENIYTYIVNSKILINRTDDKLAQQEHRVKSKEVRDLVERGLRETMNDQQLELSNIEHTTIDSAISEHFDNILLHAPFTKYGTLCGIYDKERKSVSIVIYNFGPTISATLDKNALPLHVQEFKDQIILNHANKGFFNLGRVFNRENALTLLALQEGISSKLEADISRGHGIIDFVEHCFELTHEAKISIISGNTLINIDKTYGIAMKKVLGRDRRILALNEDNEIFDKPDSKYVKNIRFNFPGVIIETTLPLNIES
jgi:hypothetical protein